MSCDWDDPVPIDHLRQWEKWKSSLIFLKDFSVNRCFKPNNFDVVEISLHHFSDASELKLGGLEELFRYLI